MLFYLNALLVFTLDQFFKFLVHRSMYFGQSIPLLNEVVRLTYVRNTGAAFSLFVGFSPYLAAVGVLVTVFVIYYHFRVPANNYLMQFGLSCLLGGSIGNLTDRLVRHYVIDYIDITIWPVFNFADLMINLGVFLILLNYLRSPEEES
ncbi:MAG: signal peptidase II [Candidatus Margulisbacteria bacterium]|jgi:signal peptidase II|nr:signal peptidase II [Candidatus Margulisiibacteriota bacterium]